MASGIYGKFYNTSYVSLMFKKIISILFLGLVFTIFSLSYDSKIDHYVGNEFKRAFERALDCKMEGTIEKVKLLSPTISFKNVTVRPVQDIAQWRWTAKKYVTQFSWWHFLYHRSLDLRVQMDEVEVHTTINNGNLLILPHLQKMATGDPNLPLFVKSVVLKNGKLVIDDPVGLRQLSLYYNGQTKRKGSVLHSDIIILNGQLVKNSFPFLQLSEGALSIECDENKGIEHIAIASTGKCTLQNIFDKPLECTITGNWKNNEGIFCFATAEKALQCPEIYVTHVDNQWQMNIKLHCPLDVIMKLLHHSKFPLIPVTGNTLSELTLIWDYPFPLIKGTVGIDSLSYKNLSGCSATFSFIHEKGKGKGDLVIAHQQFGSFEGKWDIDIERPEGQISLSNKNKITLPTLKKYYIKPAQCTVSAKLRGEGYSGKFGTIISNKKNNSCILQGNYSTQNDKVTFDGSIDKKMMHELLMPFFN